MNITVFREYYFWFEVAALVIATIALVRGRVRRTAFRTVPFYLAFIIAFDIINNLLRDDRILVTNIINRLIIPAEFVYILLLGYLLLESKTLRKWIMGAIILYLILLAKDWIFPSGKARLYVTSYTTGVLGLVVLCAVLYYELLNSSRLFAFYREPVFWFFTGVLIFYLGTLPIHLYWNLAATHDRELLIKLKNLFDTLMCIMYFFYSLSMLSFLWKKD